jgi:hypothetical protein
MNNGKIIHEQSIYANENFPSPRIQGKMESKTCVRAAETSMTCLTLWASKKAKWNLNIISNSLCNIVELCLSQPSGWQIFAWRFEDATENVSLIHDRGQKANFYLAHEIHKFLNNFAAFLLCFWNIKLKKRCFNLHIPNRQTTQGRARWKRCVNSLCCLESNAKIPPN